MIKKPRMKIYERKNQLKNYYVDESKILIFNSNNNVLALPETPFALK